MLKNSFFNLIGLGVPLLFAVFSIPHLISSLGNDRFGVLTLIWTVVSYFGLFDLGLGRALTLQVSRMLANNKRSQVNSVVWTALWIMFIFGAVAALSLFVSGPLWGHYIKSNIDKHELALSIKYMSIGVPFVVLTAAFRGILESCGAFFIMNIVRIPLGTFTFIGPLLVVLYWQPSLSYIAMVLAFGRMVGCLIYAIVAYKVLPELSLKPIYEHKHVPELFSVGGWLTVSNIVSPFMGYVDRFLIGFIISASAVAYYTTPNEMITKLWIISGALTTVLFPHFVTELSTKKSNIKSTFFKSSGVLFAVLFPICLILFIFAHQILSLWISPSFADHSYIIFRLFCVGIIINCMSHIPYTFIQSSGNTKATAIIHLLQLPIFMLMLYYLLQNYGIIGAAVAWILRMILDAGLMYAVAYKLIVVK